MAGVQKTLSLKDGFSSVLDKYIAKLEESVAKEEALAEVAKVAQEAVSKWTKAADEWAQTAEKEMRNEYGWAEAIADMSRKTLKAADDVEVLAGAFREFQKDATWKDIEVAFARFNEELAKQGGYWTEASNAFDKYDLLIDHSLDKLVKSGMIVLDGQDEFLTKLDEIATKSEEYAKERLKALEEENAQLQRILDYTTAVPRKIGAIAKSGIGKVSQHFKDMADNAKRAENPMKRLGSTIIKMGLSFFTISKLVKYFREGASRAPDEIAAHFTKLKETISNFFAGATVAAMSRMTAGVDKLNKALQSPAGQKFARLMEALARVVGDVLGAAFEKLAQFVEWIGNHIEPVAIAAGIAVALLAVHMTALAIATAAANLPLLIMIGLVAAVATALVNAGVTAEEVFGYVGAGLYGLYAFGYNLVADAYNVLASFAEFFANFARNPAKETALIFLNLADVIVGALERVAKAVDKIFGTSIGSEIARYRQGINTLADKLESGDRYTIDRMGHLDYNDYISRGFNAGSGVGAGLSDYALRNAEAQDIKAIAQNTGAIKDTLQDEDLTALIDMAERQFVSQVNLTSQTPVITVNGANTGNTEADRNALARAIAQILAEQVASMPTIGSPAYYGGRG